MMLAVRSRSSKVYHLTDTPNQPLNEVTTRCNRHLVAPDRDRSGYDWSQMGDWRPDVRFTLCPKCGMLADFMKASQERWEEEKCYNHNKDESSARARAMATEKATILNDVWAQTLLALESVGWKIGEPQYRRYTATMQVGGFTYKMELVKPETSFGVYQGTWKIEENIR